MPLKDVYVHIDLKKPITRNQFGFPCIIGIDPNGAGMAYREYRDLDTVLNDYDDQTLEYLKARAIFGQDLPPEKVAIVNAPTAADLIETLAGIYDLGWYHLVSAITTEPEITALADEIEYRGVKNLFLASDDKTMIETLRDKGYERTAMFYHPIVTEHPEAAWLGESAGKPIGSLTWKFKHLKGISPIKLTETELADIHALGANCYVTKMGDNVTSEGKMLSGEYIDIIQSKDAVQFDIEYRVQKLLNRSPKIPYDHNGISLIAAEVQTSLNQFHRQGMIAEDDDKNPMYSVTPGTRAEQADTDRANRIYRGCSFHFFLAGAIHEVRINGVIEV